MTNGAHLDGAHVGGDCVLVTLLVCIVRVSSFASTFLNVCISILRGGVHIQPHSVRVHRL